MLQRKSTDCSEVLSVITERIRKGRKAMFRRAAVAEPEIDLSNIPEKYYGKWVAIDVRDSSVIADGESMAEASEEAKKRTSREFVLTVVRPCSGGFLF